MTETSQSVPMVAITGQVPAPAIGTDAFQEADIRGVTMPITKHNYLVTDPREIPKAIAEAFYIANSGRPGPVLVDIAKDALQKMTDYNYPSSINLLGYKPQTEPNAQSIRDAAALIAQSSKPVFYIGGGVIKANASKDLLKLAELVGAPVVTTLMARGAFPDSHNQHLGMPGMHGTVAAVTAELNSSALMLQRMESMLTQIKQNVRVEEAKRVDQLHASVSSERVASQQMINRLEEDLAKTKQSLTLLESDMSNKEDLETNFEQKLIMLTKENNLLTEEIQSLRQTIKEMKNTIDLEKDEIHRHNDIVESVKREYQGQIEDLIAEVKNAKAETSTAKSMSEALESQLKVKFSSEHAQIQKIASLEKTLSDLMSNQNQVESEYKSRIDNLQRENLRLKESLESTTKYNNALQDKVKELNESLSNVIASQTILSAEQERFLEVAETYARESLEAVNAERDRLIGFVGTQRRQMEHLFAEQLRVLEGGATTGMQQRAVFESERERSVATIQKMKQHFKEVEAAEAHRRQHEAALRSSSKIPLAQLSLNASPPAISTSAARSPQSNDGRNVSNTSSPLSINSTKPRGGSNGTGGGKIFQNLNPGNLSRVLERRLVEFSGSEEDESDGDSDFTADDQSSSVQTPSIQEEVLF